MKRYDEAVTSSEISKFRGSIPSSVDKGILITTGYFTTDATRLAQEPSLKPIELVDGDELVKLMEKLELGLKRTFDVDDTFFDEFRSEYGTNGETAKKARAVTPVIPRPRELRAAE